MERFVYGGIVYDLIPGAEDQGEQTTVIVVDAGTSPKAAIAWFQAPLRCGRKADTDALASRWCDGLSA